MSDYVHQHYPKMLYRATVAGAEESCIVNDTDAHEALGADWHEHPDDAKAAAKATVEPAKMPEASADQPKGGKKGKG